MVAALAIGDSGPVAATDGIRALGAVMTGAAEVPGPGDPDGAGVAGMVVNVNRSRICYFLAVRNIAPATMAHIHAGAAGVAGPIVVNLAPPTSGFSANCTPVAQTLAADIAANPANYYVNVHNADFPAGAVRGQLRG